MAALPLRDHGLRLPCGGQAEARGHERYAAALAALSAAFWFDVFFTVPYNSPTIATRKSAKFFLKWRMV